MTVLKSLTVLKISPGLFILLVLYIVGGAELFIILEAPKEEEARLVKYENIKIIFSTSS